MTVLRFVDTNVLIYAYDLDAGSKQATAAALIEQLWQDGNGVISVQVLQEFLVNVTRKIAIPLPLPQARELVRSYRVWVRQPNDVATTLRATELMELASLSFWDALIIASAEAAGCHELLSEDLNPNQTIAGVRIVNPFLPQ
jgi:predicted nucleic acid-binding protein